MKVVRAVASVLADLVIGDDWRITLGIVPVWWLPPLAVLVLLAGTVYAARRRFAADE